MLLIDVDLFSGFLHPVTMSDHRLPGEHIHLGMTLSEYVPAGLVEEMRHLQYTAGDVVLVAYPKSGKITKLRVVG